MEFVVTSVLIIIGTLALLIFCGKWTKKTMTLAYAIAAVILFFIDLFLMNVEEPIRFVFLTEIILACTFIILYNINKKP